MSTERHKASKRWLDRQQRDTFVKQARSKGFRSRAIYKLMELDRRERLLGPGMVVIDLGAAPGGWSQYAAQRVGAKGAVVAVDVVALEPIPGVDIVQGDVTVEAVAAQVEASLGGRGVDLVLSDMAPNISGIASVDQARSRELGERAINFAVRVLKRGRHMVIKVFEGEDSSDLRQRLSGLFTQCLVRKPAASRSQSRETYLIGKGFLRTAGR